MSVYGEYCPLCRLMSNRNNRRPHRCISLCKSRSILSTYKAEQGGLIRCRDVHSGRSFVCQRLHQVRISRNTTSNCWRCAQVYEEQKKYNTAYDFLRRGHKITDSQLILEHTANTVLKQLSVPDFPKNFSGYDQFIKVAHFLVTRETRKSLNNIQTTCSR